MTSEARLDYILGLDNELLGGCTVLPEWCSFIIRDADIAYIGGANLAAILTSVAGIEAFLRAESDGTHKERLVTLIDECGFSYSLKIDLHKLRKYRNTWVHVDDPWDDSTLLYQPEDKQAELEKMANFALRVLRQTVYQSQGV